MVQIVRMGCKNKAGIGRGVPLLYWSLGCGDGIIAAISWGNGVQWLVECLFLTTQNQPRA